MTAEGRAARRRKKLRHVMDVLVKHKGVVKAAAEELGSSERTVNEQIREFCAIEGYRTPFEAAYRLAEQDFGGENGGLAQ